MLIFVSFSPTYARWEARGNPVQFFFLSQIFGTTKNFFSKSNTKNCHLSNQFWSRNFVSKSNHLFDIAVSNQKISNETPCTRVPKFLVPKIIKLNNNQGHIQQYTDFIHHFASMRYFTKYNVASPFKKQIFLQRLKSHGP